MRVRTLTEVGSGSYGVVLPRDELQYLGILTEDGRLADPDQQVLIESDGAGQLVLQLCGADQPTDAPSAD